ncbi:hypothetical protein [Thiofilum flexile]|uniref:hypothetical protein n=1 Tax=Thiofilum flexile TaxID=125627 RepID=UPI00035E7B46|nr:hypothetical protein [Thiofilum flexile]
MVWNLVNPWWLTLVFAVLLLITLRLSRAHVTSKGLLLVTALAVLLFSAYLVWQTFGYVPTHFVAWVLGMILAFLVNELILRSPRGVFYVTNKKRFIFPGSLGPFFCALGLTVWYYLLKVGQLESLPWSNWPYLNYIGSFGYGFWGGYFIAFFVETLRAQKERPIGQSQLSRVYWTVAS